LRGQKIALRGDFLPRSLPAANSIYPPLADNKKNSGIHAAGCAENGSLPDFGIGVCL
jgi:hypothetical protein